MNRPANLVEPHRPAPLAQQLHNQYGPLIPDAGQRLADHGALTRVVDPLAIFEMRCIFESHACLETVCRLDAVRLHRLINVTGFQISAFLRVPPVVTILALVTKRNQAT